MGINSIDLSMQQINYNPIKAYNSMLKGGISLDRTLPDTNNFEDILNKEFSKQTNSNNNSSVDSLMSSISNALGGGLNDVDTKRKAADYAQEALARGEDVSVHDVMIAAEKSALSMQMAMQVRNKMINAYNEIKNISL